MSYNLFYLSPDFLFRHKRPKPQSVTCGPIVDRTSRDRYVCRYVCLLIAIAIVGLSTLHMDVRYQT